MKQKTVENLYKNTKQIPLFAFISLIFPIAMFIALPLSIVWIIQRKKLLNIDPTELDNYPPEKIELIRAKGWYLWLPTVFFIGILIAIVGIYLRVKFI